MRLLIEAILEALTAYKLVIERNDRHGKTEIKLQRK